MINIHKIHKAYDNKILYQDFSLELFTEEITVILGSSGCGKTTLLKLLSGIERPKSGTIEGIDHEKLSIVFQEDRLIPWLNVRENIQFVLKQSPENKERQENQIDEILKLLHLESDRHAPIQTLSGGMQRRVSLARALAYTYKYILLDEPFKGMDKALKLEVIQSIRQIWQSERKTVIIITHDEEEAHLLADHIYYFYGHPIQYKKIK